METEPTKDVEQTDAAPGPVSQPAAMSVRPLLQVLSWVGGVAAGGIFIVLVASNATRTQGATRSVRLRWQQQQRPPVQCAMQTPQGSAQVVQGSTQMPQNSAQMQESLAQLPE
jgi:hypothetical protein